MSSASSCEMAVEQVETFTCPELSKGGFDSSDAARTMKKIVKSLRPVAQVSEIWPTKLLLRFQIVPEFVQKLHSEIAVGGVDYSGEAATFR